jgi:aspartyl-tRNA(Asn)/glutamyl-tRNA(Gln) amidotransferase subunit A
MDCPAVNTPLVCGKRKFEMSKNLLQSTATDLGRLIEAGEISPLELTQTYLDAIDAHPLAHRIYARTTHERAISEAKAATARAVQGTRNGPLDGVPISWKDLFDTDGVGTEAGSAFLKGRVPHADAEVLKNATQGGLVCLGKTHMSELAFSGLGLNPVTQSPPCVNDPNAVAGGSSSGAAASVAFNIAAAAIGSDTGGSVRIPSAWNDLVGLKTTSGLLPLKGVVPLCAKFDTVGPLCRSVEDAANLYAILGGTKPMQFQNTGLKGKRFAICSTLALDTLEDAPKSAFEHAIQSLKDAGALVEKLDIPEINSAMPLAGCLFTTEAYAQWQSEIDTTPELMYPAIRDRFLIGKTYSGYEYVQAWQKLDQLRESYLKRTAGYDAVLLPSSPTLPPNVEKLEQDSEYYISANLLALRNTRIGNLMGLCGLTLPTSLPSCGLMICCNPFEERKLLTLGADIEAALK